MATGGRDPHPRRECQKRKQLFCHPPDILIIIFLGENFKRKKTVEIIGDRKASAKFKEVIIMPKKGKANAMQRQAEFGQVNFCCATVEAVRGKPLPFTMVSNSIFYAGLNRHEYLVYLYLCHLADRGNVGNSFPSHAKVSDVMDICVSNVKAAIKGLAAKRLVTVQYRYYRLDERHLPPSERSYVYSPVQIRCPEGWNYTSNLYTVYTPEDPAPEEMSENSAIIPPSDTDPPPRQILTHPPSDTGYVLKSIEKELPYQELGESGDPPPPEAEKETHKIKTPKNDKASNETQLQTLGVAGLVHMSQNCLNRLNQIYGDEEVADYVWQLDNAISTGRVKSPSGDHALTIESWIRRDNRLYDSTPRKAPRQLNRFCNFEQRNTDYARLESMERKFLEKLDQEYIERKNREKLGL